MEPLKRADDAEKQLVKDFKYTTRRTKYKKVDLNQVLVNFGKFCTNVCGADITITDYEQGLPAILNGFVDNDTLTETQNVWLFKATLHLIKAVFKKGEKQVSEEVIALLNKWQSVFWTTDLSESERRGLFGDLSKAVDPLLYIRLSGSELEFGRKEAMDQDKEFSKNIDKVTDQKSFISLPEAEQWAISHSLKTMSTNLDKESVGQKLSLALKKSSASLHDLINIHNSKRDHSETTMISCLKSIFESSVPSSHGYSDETKEDINKLLGIFSKSYDTSESIKAVAGLVSKVENVIPITLMNPNIKRNFIAFTYSVIEVVLKKDPNEFYDQFFSFLKLALHDLRAQAEESLTEHDSLFIENYQRCYLAIPEMILMYADQKDRIDQILSTINEEFKNTKLSICQLHVLFTTHSLLARSRNMETNKIDFFSFELTNRRCSLDICVEGSLSDKTNSTILSIRRDVVGNSISVEITGRHAKSYKVNESVNKMIIRSLLDPKQGAISNGIEKLKVLDESKTAEAVLYSHIAFYNIFHSATSSNDKIDKKCCIVDTLLNFVITNNATVSRTAINSLTNVALQSTEFFQNILYIRLFYKMLEYDESLELPEEEKLSDFVLHPHKSKNIKNLVACSLDGTHLNRFNKSLLKKQEGFLDTQGLAHLLVSFNSPTVYNFDERGNHKHNTISSYLKTLKEHYETRQVDFEDIIGQVSKFLVDKMASKMFIFSSRAHFRMIAVNVCGSISGICSEFYELVSSTFKLKTTIDQVKKCLRSKEIFEEQYSKISFYDMNQIADSAGALLNIFGNKIKADSAAKAVKTKPEKEAEEVKLTPVSTELPKKAKDVNNMLLGAGKKTKATKKKDAAKTKAKNAAPASKEEPVLAKKETEPKIEVPKGEETKEDRVKRDLNTVNAFLDHTFANSCTYIESICSIYELASKGKSDGLLDKIIYQNIHTFIELLRYPNCNFIIKNKLPKLLANSSGDNTILRIKDCLIECLLISAQLLNNVDMKKEDVDKQFKAFFKIISEEDLDFSKLGKGMIRLILTNVNFAIKHFDISLTYKENAVEIAYKILKSSESYNTSDILRVAQTLLGQDYVSKCGNAFLTHLFATISDKHRMVLCSRLFDYHNLQLTNFLNVVFEYNKPLPRSEDFEVQLWIKQYDEEPINKIAQKVWNKYYSNADVIQKGTNKRNRIMNFSQYALDAFGDVSKSTTEAFVAAIGIDKDLLYEYIETIREIIKGCANPFEVEEQFKFFASVVNSVSNLIDASQLDKLLEFIIYEGYLNTEKEISSAFERCGISVCIEQGRENSKKILMILKTYLLNPLNGKNNLDAAQEGAVLNEILVLIASLATHFDKSDESTLDIYERIIEMLNIPSTELKKSISKCISPLSKLLVEKSEKFLKQLMAMLSKTKDHSTLSGAAYAISGIVKGLGISAIDKYQILDTLESEAFSKKASPFSKLALLNCYEAFAYTLGKSFELYSERVVPKVLNSFSDPKEMVRNAGKKALDVIMMNISGYCVNKIMSDIFLEGIEEANWRIKLGQIEALCSMAMFAPNQVAAHLPEVISSIRTILLDTHPKVQDAGQGALKKITSAMRDQGRLNSLAILEVHSEQIAKSSATENLTKALDHLLDTTFMHALDEPSLALLMPLIKDGLEAANRKVQIKALRIVGHICSITGDSYIVMPYMKEIAPIMVNLLLTVHPKVRSASCKALAGLVKGIGVIRCIGVCKWILAQLRFASVSEHKNIEFKYEEIDVDSTDLEEIWREELAKIEDLCLKENSNHRVAGITLLVDFHRFMSCFKNHQGCEIDFTNYSNKVIPMFENALLDTNEDVRAASVKGLRLAIETFGEDCPDLLFDQLLKGYKHGNYWIRFHTIVLMSTLLHVLGGDIHKIKKDEERGQVGTINCYEEVISATYILSYDLVERVSFTASSAWQLFIEKRQGRNLVAPFNDSSIALRRLIFEMILVIASEYQEVVSTGTRALNNLMGKIFEKLMEESLDILENSFEGITDLEAVQRFTYFHHLVDT
jgi:hypothetical protein